jgi:hypothetical protein
MLFRKSSLLLFLLLISITLSGCGKLVEDRQDSIIYLAENIDYTKLKNIKSEIKPFKNCQEVNPACSDLGITQLFNSYYNLEKSCTGFSDIVKYYNLSEARYYANGENFSLKNLVKNYEPFSPKNNWLKESCLSNFNSKKIVTGSISNSKSLNILVVVNLSKSKSGIYQLSSVFYDYSRLNNK